MDNNELQYLVERKYDPIKMQVGQIDRIEELMNDEASIVDPTNPFVMLTEMSAYNTSALLQEQNVLLRKLYPSLAINNDDIFQHMSDEDYLDTFSTPSVGGITVMLNLKEFIANGIVDEADNSITTIIPEETKITVSDTVFTFLNSVKIKYYPNTKKAIAEQLVSEKIVSDNNLGILNTTILSKDGSDYWIAFEILLKQVKIDVLTDNIITSTGYNKEFILEDKFYYAEVYIKNNKTNNIYTPVTTTHSDNVFNPDKPTVILKVADKKLKIEIPKIFILNESLVGDIMIKLYTTKGKLFLPLNKFSSEEFEMEISDTRNTIEASILNINKRMESRLVVDGGRDGKTIDEIRESIIQNTVGKNKIPITELELRDKALANGFKLFKANDTVTNRTFLATKNLTIDNNSGIEANCDIFLNTPSFILDKLPKSKFINFNGDKLLLRSNLYFKEINGIIKVLTDDEIAELEKLTTIEKIKLLKTNKYFFNIYYYIIDISNDKSNSLESRIYDLDSPEILTTKIIAKNGLGSISVNIDKWKVEKTYKGYKFYFTLIGNEAYNGLDKNKIHLQLGIRIPTSNDLVYFTLDYHPEYHSWYFELETDFYLTEEDYLPIKNGISDLYTKFIDLDFIAEVLIYSTADSVIKTNFYLKNEIYDKRLNVEVFTKEEINIKLGNRIKYLWNKVNTAFTDRKYKTYNIDVPLVYEKDIYEEDPDTCSIFDVEKKDDDDCCKNIKYKLLHKKGDPVLDEKGNPVYKARKGDIILDDNGFPIIDEIGGKIRFIDMLMLEIEFKLSQNSLYKEYLKTVKATLNTWLLSELTELNKIVLEKTDIFYRPTYMTQMIQFKLNNNIMYMPYNVSPKITLYTIKNSNIITKDFNVLRKNIGNILKRHFEKTDIVLDDIKREIAILLGKDLRGVKIENLDNGLNVQVFKLMDEMKKINLNKTMRLDINNNFFPIYDIDIKLEIID